eukprot:m.22127 g.22127  ORF g.22127 m.22127 type:complete len:250 (+) comp11206_c0_seq1:126-875(+)
MGCGGSKAAEIKVAPGQAITEVAAVAAPDPKGANNENTDLNKGAIITEQTEGGESVAAQGLNETADLSIGATPVSKSSSSTDQDDDVDDESTRMMSAVSTRSAPSIMQRPSSRGGSAFDIQWGEESGQAKMPRRLEKLHHSSKRRKQELTLDQLQKKLQAAERRKQEYEDRLKAKMAAEVAKAQGVRAGAKNRDLESKVEQAERDAEGNREKRLKEMRDKLRAKEEHARKVREKKRLLQQENAEAEAEA